MTDPMLDRQVRRRLAILRHADEMTGNVAMTCRYFGISRQVFYTWRRRYDELGADGLRDRSRRPPGISIFFYSASVEQIAAGRVQVGRRLRADAAPGRRSRCADAL